MCEMSPESNLYRSVTHRGECSTSEPRPVAAARIGVVNRVVIVRAISAVVILASEVATGIAIIAHTVANPTRWAADAGAIRDFVVVAGGLKAPL